MKTWKNVTLTELPIVAKEVLATLEDEGKEGASVLLLSGELGAGKTTFTQMLGRVLGAENNIVSPTYTIVRSYPLAHSTWKLFVHVDAYRLVTATDLETIGLQKWLDNKAALVIIEWPEKIAHALNPETYILSFAEEREGVRTLTLQKLGEASLLT